MDIGKLKDQLIEICESKMLDGSQGAIFPEPYIPYIPDKWNGVLVLAEAQNLAKSNDNYVATLKNYDKRKKIERLYHAVKTENRVRIQPWDDGSLQLAVEVLNEEPDKTAVSNSVMWSLRNKNGANKTPTAELKKNSRAIWTKLLKEMNPKIILTAGAVARSVIQPIWSLEKQVNLRSSSPVAMAVLAGRTASKEVDSTRETINRLKKKYPDWFKKHSRFKELYIWHTIKTVNKG